MRRELAVIAVVASLLWCPFRCLEAAASMSIQPGPVAASQSRCSCCHSRKGDGHQESSQPAPAEDSNGCECPDCVCGGAVLDGNTAKIAATVMAPFHVIASSADAIDAVQDISIPDGYRDVWRSFAPSGHDIVILHRNLRR